jgi:flagellin-like protein
MRMFRSKKGLSPVVASIILIAVTVAVSIAVAAWMGALTFTFMGTEQLQITNMSFGPAGASSWIAVTVNNTGTSPVTINEAWINNVKKTTTSPALPTNVAANAGVVLNLTSTALANGNNYQVKLVSSKGNQFYYSAVAPTS